MISDKYLNSKKVNGASENTIRNYVSLLKGFNEYKPLEQWNEEDINIYILKIKKEYAEASVEGQKTIMKDFFKWFGKPEWVTNIKINKVENKLNINDILNAEEVNKLIEATESPMYKALIALLYESGGRIGEILRVKDRGVRVRDCVETDKGLVVSVHQSKTGKDFRRILCVFSGQYIRNHITYSAKDKDDFLFDLSKPAVWEMLKKIGKKAGIEKPLSAQKFRHAQATVMVQQGYNESIIRKKLGWSATSSMIARYQHMSDEDVINATAEHNGGDIPKPVIANLNKAEPLKIADASMQLSKLSEENQELKDRMAQRDAEFDDMKRQMEFITAALQAKQVVK